MDVGCRLDGSNGPKALATREVGSTVLGSALNALGRRRRWAAVQKQNVKLVKSGEEDGRFNSESSTRADVYGEAPWIVRPKC
jgi:hypothetical protein